MRSWLVCTCLVAVMLVPLIAQQAKSMARVRWIILGSRHLGAHGMGYNQRSMTELSKRLTPADIATLIALAAPSNDISVGAQFALASQCESAIPSVRGAAVQHKMNFLDAEDTMSLMSEFDGCSRETRSKASAMLHTLEQLNKEENARMEREFKQKNEDNARIQGNGLKLLDRDQAKTLTREERLEIYCRSLAAMGLKEDGPMTPEQKKLAEKMYRTMVLGESDPPKPQ